MGKSEKRESLFKTLINWVWGQEHVTNKNTYIVGNVLQLTLQECLNLAELEIKIVFLQPSMLAHFICGFKFSGKFSNKKLEGFERDTRKSVNLIYLLFLIIREKECEWTVH